jgi:signal transduction histidine kinase
MRERALSLGGTYELKSAPEKGTAITVRVPMTDARRNAKTRREEAVAEAAPA